MIVKHRNKNWGTTKNTAPAEQRLVEMHFNKSHIILIKLTD